MAEQPFNALSAKDLAAIELSEALLSQASQLRDEGFGRIVTYSRKFFIPLTHLCRDVCHYCTFAKTPKRIGQPYMSADDVVAQAKQAAEQGCREALFTLGEKPELRYRVAREALAEMGFGSTIEYVAHVAGRVLNETGLLPHINAGCMTPEEIALLRPVSASMGIMLESASPRLCEKGMPHYGSPDKDPAVRLQTLEDAGRAKVPFTTGILIGIGETRLERVESLMAIRDVHRRHGHIQEIIIQNFRAKPDTQMALAPEPDLQDLLWTLAIARVLFGSEMSIQVPPNLSPGVLPQLVAAGINDWGGVSPVTPDYVNPEAPWPHVDDLARETAVAGKILQQRLTAYPHYVKASGEWVDPAVLPSLLRLSNGAGMPRQDGWLTGCDTPPPPALLQATQQTGELAVSAVVQRILDKAEAGQRLDPAEIERLFESRGDDFAAVCRSADQLRQKVNGEVVSYVVNRNINYTNICYFKCSFCAFSKGKLSENLRGRPYDLDQAEIARRSEEAWARGASEVCMQGGIHPEYTGDTYLNILRTIRKATPDMHIHAFSPLEVWQGAETLSMDLADYLRLLQSEGLSTLPGTAAEILDDRVRATLCPDKINTEQWLQVMRTAHQQGLRSTATIMYGHIETYRDWATHLLAVRDLQSETGGFTEFVPLPFVADEAPMYLRGQARRGPTFRESVLMHAVARLVFFGLIDNIQVSWVKMGEAGVKACLNAGVNDLGGTLMNESITRAAGASHGEEVGPGEMQRRIRDAGRTPRLRNTLYGEVDPGQGARAQQAAPLLDIVNTPARKYERKRNREENNLIAVS